jgi:hypothetical protein
LLEAADRAVSRFACATAFVAADRATARAVVRYVNTY